MSLIFTGSEMSRYDRSLVEKGLCTSIELMQRAAECLYEEVSAELDRRGIVNVLLLAGRGNNGGDAYALALLLQRDYRPTLFSVREGERSPDCQYFYQKCLEAEIPFTDSLEGFPLIIEGVFGNGFRGSLPEEIRTLFSAIKVPVISIDVPAGMYADSGRRVAGTLVPERTVTFVALKPCHLLGRCGKVVLKDLGFPLELKNKKAWNTLEPVVLPRSEKGWKTYFGKAALLVGSRKYTGAASLALLGAMRSGAGLIYGYLPAVARRVAAVKFASPILLPPRKLKLGEHNAYLAGSGLGRSLSTLWKTFRLWRSDEQVVFDGDALWCLSFFRGPFLQCRGKAVLTPHVGEMARLVGKSVREVQSDRISNAIFLATQRKAVVVLKDFVTVIATPDQKVWILSAPCSALGKGGSGDLLAGLITGLWANGHTAEEAARTGVWLHNRAAHLAAEEHNVRYLQPEEIAEYIDKAWQQAINTYVEENEE